jgi:hypothetical protein
VSTTIISDKRRCTPDLHSKPYGGYFRWSRLQERSSLAVLLLLRYHLGLSHCRQMSAFVVEIVSPCKGLRWQAEDGH